MRKSEPGYEAVAVPDGRRGLWVRREFDWGEEFSALTIASGREGDDEIATLRAGEEITLRSLSDLYEALDTLRYAHEVAADDARSGASREALEAARAAGHAEIADALERLEAGLVSARTRTAQLEADVLRLSARAGECGRLVCPGCRPPGCRCSDSFRWYGLCCSCGEDVSCVECACAARGAGQ